MEDYDFFSDEELDEMFDDTPPPMQQAPTPGVARSSQLAMPEPVPLYALELAEVGQPQQPAPTQPNDQQQGLLMKKWGPLPVWAWGLIGLGVSGGGYALYRGLKPNPSSRDDEDDDGGPKIGEIISKAIAGGTSSDGGMGGWEPSRSRFAEQLDRYFQRKGQGQHVKVWHDAEDAKKDGGLKFVSPLLNIQVKNGAVKVDQALTRFCRKEGLNPTTHPDGSIGLYPHTGKRGKEWEEYVDALRDDGQEI